MLGMATALLAPAPVVSTPAEPAEQPAERPSPISTALPQSEQEGAMAAAGLGLLAAAAAAPYEAEDEMEELGKARGHGEEVEPTADDDGDGTGLVVANAVLDSLPSRPPTADEQGAIIAKQQKESAALRELVASQAAHIEQLRRATHSNCHIPHPSATVSASAPGTSPPPLYGPASPSSELVVAEDLDVLSPSSNARPQSGLSQLGHGHYHPQLALIDGPATTHYHASAASTSVSAPPELRPPPTPTSSRTPPHVDRGHEAKRMKGADGVASAAPSPSSLAYSSVTLSLPPYRTTISAKARPPQGRTNTHVLWTPQEDACLRALVEAHGEQAWALVASRMPHERNNKQCRERWRNHLRPQCNKGPWTEAEDALILERVQQHGTKWAKISGLYLPDRPENDIKNRWHILVRMNQQNAALAHTAHASAPSAEGVATSAAPSEHTAPSDAA